MIFDRSPSCPPTSDLSEPLVSKHESKQCQFCSHFQPELTHWGHCKVLSALVPGKNTACILHESCFGERKTTDDFPQLPPLSPQDALIENSPIPLPLPPREEPEPSLI